MKIYKTIILFLFTFTVFYSCKTGKPTLLTYYPATDYNYSLTANDSLYMVAFINNDSHILVDLENIVFLMSRDSLIVNENNTVKKFYKDTFEVHEIISDKEYFVYKYSFSGTIISIANFFNNELQYEKLNVDGYLQLRNAKIQTTF